MVDNADPLNDPFPSVRFKRWSKGCLSAQQVIVSGWSSG